MNETRAQRSNTRQEVLDFPQVEESTLFEDQIEARLQELTRFVEGFADSTFNLVLVEQISVRQTLEELVVKVATLRWIVRVASYSNGPIRKKLWAEIDGALIDLEKTGESLMHAGIERPLPNSMVFATK
ncbi:MAG TPA: hypothetical protein VKH18_07455 [Terriglobales bacterium]|nr:hypothetical protein [Terriglobales bacterium]